MLVQDVERKVQDGVARRSNAERASGEAEAGIMEDALRGSYRQRDQQEAQRPIAGLMDGLGDRPRTEFVGRGLIGNPQRRKHRRYEGGDLHRRPAPGSFAKEWHEARSSTGGENTGPQDNAQSNAERRGFTGGHDLKRDHFGARVSVLSSAVG